MCLLALAAAVTLDLLVVIDKSEPLHEHGIRKLVDALQHGDRVAVATVQADFKLQQSFTDDPVALEGASAKATAATRALYRPHLYDAAGKAADIFGGLPNSERVVIFITFNRERLDKNRATAMAALYRRRGIRMQAIVMPAYARSRGGASRGSMPYPNIGICDPVPGCPDFMQGVRPDLHTLDAIATGSKGHVFRLKTKEQIDWSSVLASLRRSTAASGSDVPRR